MPLSPISILVRQSSADYLRIPYGDPVSPPNIHSQISTLVGGIIVPSQELSQPPWQLGWPVTQFSGQWDLSKSLESFWESFSLPDKRDWLSLFHFIWLWTQGVMAAAAAATLQPWRKSQENPTNDSAAETKKELTPSRFPVVADN